MTFELAASIPGQPRSSLDNVALSELPRIQRLTLSMITTVPEWHPGYATFEPYPVHAWLIWHPEGIVLVDTGVGFGNDLIDQWYRPQVTPLDQALGDVGLVPSDVSKLVLSHLHFDHCGQQADLSAPTYVQVAEWEAAQGTAYTVDEWADVPEERLELVDGDVTLLDGVQLLSTPGHTPGRQSVLIEAGEQRTVLATQCAFRSGEIQVGQPDPANLYSDEWSEAARESLDRIRALRPAVVHLSHDPHSVVLG
jgi:N-acyl homoserine lactone hydrolase